MNPARWLSATNQPQNLREREAFPDALERDVRQALATARGYLSLLPGGDPAWLLGKDVMEIGPGFHHGVSLILACFGARMTVCDRFPPAWQPAYHPAFYALLLERLPGEFPGIDRRPLEAIRRDGSSIKDHVTELGMAVERIPRSLRNRFDAIFSNAVLEHLFLPSRAIRRLALITRPGGLGFHQIDFRDHRDFSRPLEYLLLDRIHFWKTFYWSHGECGNRLRPAEFTRLFARSGFTLQTFEVNLSADAAYKKSFIPKLRSAPSIYARWPEAELTTLGGRMQVVRT